MDLDREGEIGKRERTIIKASRVAKTLSIAPIVSQPADLAHLARKDRWAMVSQAAASFRGLVRRSAAPSETKPSPTRSNSPVMIRWLSKDMATEYDTMIARARVLSCLTRIEVWCTVGEIGMYPTDIASTLSLAPSTVTHHLRVLHEAGLVSFEQQGRHRLYRVTGERWGIVSAAELEAGVVA